MIFPNAKPLQATIAAIDRTHDLALLKIRQVAPPPLKVVSNYTHGVLQAAGFGPRGRYQSVQGNIVRMARRANAQWTHLEMRGQVRSGDSGGPVLNSDGELVGVVWGASHGTTHATCGEPIRRLLDRVFGKQQSKPIRPVQPIALEPQGGLSPVPSAPDWRPWGEKVDARLDAIDKQLGAANAERGSLGEKIVAVRGVTDGVASRLQGIADRVTRLASLASVATEIGWAPALAGALGLGGPIGIALVAGSWILKKRGRGGPRDDGFPSAQQGAT